MTNLHDLPSVDVTQDPTPHAPPPGNTHDDDGLAIDQMFEAADASPVTYAGVEYPVETILSPTRILSRKLNIGTDPKLNGGAGGLIDPVQIFPVDLNRRSFTIQSDAAVVIGSQLTDVFNGATLTPTAPIRIEDHTGAIWIYSTDATLKVCTVMCVTQ